MLMRVVVTLIGPDGTMRRRMVDTATSRDTGPWEELLARALAVLPPYRAVPGGQVDPSLSGTPGRCPSPAGSGSVEVTVRR